MSNSGWMYLICILSGIIGALLAGRKELIRAWRDRSSRRYVGTTQAPSQCPENPYDISKLSLQFPYHRDNSARGCPVDMEEILDYLACEAVDGEDLTEANLEFVRTARVGKADVWLWRFYEPGGKECYVMVELRPGGTTCVGYNTSDVTCYDEEVRRAKLTAEQFIFASYHHVF